MIPKFRAWHKKEKRMYNPLQLLFDYEHEAVDVVLTIRRRTVVFEAGKEIILMQSTGLRDKHDKEIFEGDIIRFEGDLHTVERDNENASFTLYHKCKRDVDKGVKDSTVWDFSNTEPGELKVIGNIHENPELLEQG